MKDWLTAHDKLNTVAAVIMIIWGGIAVHLWRLTLKVQALEKKLLQNQSSQA
ncbi:MAG: hypothetical protein RMJ66_05950 [Bacteroidia bacterium]|nr:hypothetical protein [Bacteroidia bacterium]MDW8134593.1 hypothetical protein [Bacteroidia bacterium]